MLLPALMRNADPSCELCAALAQHTRRGGRARTTTGCELLIRHKREIAWWEMGNQRPCCFLGAFAQAGDHPHTAFFVRFSLCFMLYALCA
jgi:hypothetical protein